MKAADKAVFDISNNQPINLNIGQVDISAGGTAWFQVKDNISPSTIVVATERAISGAVTERGSITIAAAGVGSYDGATASRDSSVGGFLIGGNATSFDNTTNSVFLGNVDISAKSTLLPSSADIVASIASASFTSGSPVGRSNIVDIGNFDGVAGGDIHFAGNGSATNSVLRMGDITLTSGDYVPAGTTPSWSSDLYFKAQSLLGNNDNDLIATNNTTGASDNGQQIVLNAKSVGTAGVGDVYANIAGAPNLTLLSASGTNAEIYLTGSIGPVTSGSPAFTLDLTGMTGGFNTVASAYDPMGIAAGSNSGQDSGSYVVTTAATFGGAVQILIGSGDLIYNAQHSAFTGSASDLAVNTGNFDNDWFGAGSNNEGWFSLGGSATNYLAPTVAQQSFTINGVSGDPTGPDANLLRMHSVLIETGTQEFAAVIDYRWEDANNFGFGNTGSFSWDRTSDVTWYEFTGASYVERDVEYVEAALGGVDITYQYGADTSSVAATTVTITGATDGSAFDYIIAASRSFGDGIGRLFDALSGGASPTTFATTPGVAPVDGVGNIAKEVFVFTDANIGEIVIGGFNTQINSANTLRAGEVDYLDFSQLGLAKGDLDFLWENSDGYFADLLIGFKQGTGVEGSIRLVGVGEYVEDGGLPSDMYLSAVENSILFNTFAA